MKIAKMEKKRLAIIDNSIDLDIYNPVEHWRPYLNSVPWRAFRAKLNHFPDLDDFSHILLTGSESSILDREDWAREEIQVVQEAREKGLSILGSCYGHQLLAVALSGEESVRRCSQPEIGWVEIQIYKANELLGKTGSVYTFTLHFDEVTGLGDEFDIFAKTEQNPVQVFCLKNSHIWGIQPHPEIDVTHGKMLLKALVSRDPKAKAEMENALKGPYRDSGLIRSIIGNFLKS